MASHVTFTSPVATEHLSRCRYQRQGCNAFSRSLRICRSQSSFCRGAALTAYRRLGQRAPRQLICPQGKGEDRIDPLAYRSPTEADIGLRSEAEAPFRSLRLVLFGFFAVSASIATLFALVQLVGALGGGPNALPLQDTVQGLGIDVASVAVFAFLLRGDLRARDKQMARLTREEKLGALQLELANKKVLRLAQLRGFSRVVMVAGTPDQVSKALEAAEPYKEDLIARGVMVVPLPLYEGEAGSSAPAPLPPLTQEDLRWRAMALRQGEWADWFRTQLELSSATAERGLYVGLRLDGRVRSSGMGTPPWPRFVAELAPNKSGLFQGLFDGMDGRV